MLISHSQRDVARTHGVSQEMVSYLLDSSGGRYYLSQYQAQWAKRLVEQAIKELEFGINPATGLRH